MNELNQLRNNIDFASISQFLHTFQSAFGPWTAPHQLSYPRTNEQPGVPFETEDLEAMILQVSERIRLEDMFVRMLRVLTRNRFINHSSWQNYFAKEFDKREPDEENPFYTVKVEQKPKQQQEGDEGTKEGEDVQMTEATEATEMIEEREAVNYFTLPLDVRVHLIYLLCEWQMDEPEKLREHLETEDDCIQWRVDPIGFDKRGDIFWLFDDNRLYKESVTKPRQKKTVNKKKRTTKGSRRSARNSKTEQQDEEVESEETEEWKPWKLLCASSAEWEHIPEKFAQSTHVDEKNFHDLLVNDVLPKVLPAVIEHEKELKKREALMHRKRSSRIMIKELEALERANSIEPEEERKTVTAASADSNQRSSSRIERRTAEKEEKEREMLAKAREERLLEREKRIMEREYRRLAREKREEARENGENIDEIDILNNQPSENNSIVTDSDAATTTTPTIPLKLIVKDKNQQSENQTTKKKRGRKPKMKTVDPTSTDESWMFDCICGVKGENLDDGSPMIACENCGVWQHIKCLRKSGQVHANKKTLDNIIFMCRSCRIKNGEDVDQEQHRPIKKQKTDKQQKHKQQQQQQQQQQYQVTLPNIQIWDRIHSPQITVISPQPPLQPQPLRPILQAQPQPPIIQSSHSRPILHPILEPKPITITTITTTTNSNNNNNNSSNNHAAAAVPTTAIITQPAAVLEPQPAILEPNHSFQSQPHPPPILPQPVLPPPSKLPTILPPQPSIQSTILPSQPPLQSSFQRASPLPPPKQEQQQQQQPSNVQESRSDVIEKPQQQQQQQQPPSNVQETRSDVIEKPQQPALEAQPPAIIPSASESQPTTTVINEPTQSTPTQSATDVTIETQEKPSVPLSNNNS